LAINRHLGVNSVMVNIKMLDRPLTPAGGTSSSSGQDGDGDSSSAVCRSPQRPIKSFKVRQGKFIGGTRVRCTYASTVMEVNIIASSGLPPMEYRWCPCVHQKGHRLKMKRCPRQQYKGRYEAVQCQLGRQPGLYPYEGKPWADLQQLKKS